MASGNLGQNNLRRKRRAGDPMAAFDGLPAPLRHWLAHAALPWSPASARRIWTKYRNKGLDSEEILDVLARAEARSLARDKSASSLGAPAEI